VNGLLEEWHPGLEHLITHDRVVGIARRVEHAQVRPPDNEMFGELTTAHPRPDDVGQELMDFAGVVPASFGGVPNSKEKIPSSTPADFPD
jgi:hypothetical protein